MLTVNQINDPLRKHNIIHLEPLTCFLPKTITCLNCMCCPALYTVQSRLVCKCIMTNWLNYNIDKVLLEGEKKNLSSTGEKISVAKSVVIPQMKFRCIQPYIIISFPFPGSVFNFARLYVGVTQHTTVDDD